MRQEKEKAKQQFDKKIHAEVFRAGYKVLLYDEAIRRCRSINLDALWIGPSYCKRIVM